jgi:hypothetical protein
MTTITIPREMASKDDLVVIPKREYDALVAHTHDAVTEQDVLRWSREAKALHRTGALPKLA